MAATMRAPDGRTWTVRRRWAPRTPRWRWLVRIGQRHEAKRKRYGPGDAAGDLLANVTPTSGDQFVALVLLVAAIAAMVLIGIPLLVFVLDVLLILVLVVLGAVARVLFRRPWTIEAATTGEFHRYAVSGWGASRRAVDELSAAIRAGRALPGVLRSGARAVSPPNAAP